MAMDLVRWSDEGMAIGWVDRVWINVLRRPMRLEHARVIRRLAGEHRVQFGNRSVSMSVLEDTAFHNVSDEVRQETSALVREFPTLGVATVIEGTGFRVAAGRMMMAGIYMVARVKHPQKVFDKTAEAARWMGGILSDHKE